MQYSPDLKNLDNPDYKEAVKNLYAKLGQAIEEGQGIILVTEEEAKDGGMHSSVVGVTGAGMVATIMNLFNQMPRFAKTRVVASMIASLQNGADQDDEDESEAA